MVKNLPIEDKPFPMQVPSSLRRAGMCKALRMLRYETPLIFL
jgi:hypothetical protein